MLFVSMSVFTDAQNSCAILAPSEPERIIARRSPNQVSQNPNVLGHVEWENVNEYKVSDDQSVSIELGAADRSNQIRFSDFDYNIPEGSIITGIQVVIEGGSTGDGKMLDMQVQLMSGNPVGENKANYPIYGDAWEIIQDGEEDEIWRYGFGYSTWQKDWSPAEINSPGFGVALQIENEGWANHTSYIDQIYIKVYYLPVYDLCLHDCTLFFVEPIEGVTEYTWQVPPEFEHLASPTNQHIANLNFIDSIVGTYQICVTPQGHSTCCRTFVLNDCSKGSIGDMVWLDSNADGLMDVNEPALSGIIVDLYNESGIRLETQITDNAGKYLFENLCEANYRIKLRKDELYEGTINNSSDEELNSDFDYSYGECTTGFIHLEAGQDLRNIDFGLIAGGEVTGMVWKDENGDGEMDNENGISELTVALYSCEGILIEQTTTDEDGKYSFNEVMSGSYYIMTSEEQYLRAFQEGQSHFTNENGDNTTSCFEVGNGNNEEINLAYVPLLIVGDLVWEDSNKNGIQDPGEPGIPDVLVTIFDENGDYYNAVYTDINGNFWLVGNIPGQYYLAIEDVNGWIASPSNSGSDDNLDSDGIFSNGMLRTELFTVSGCENISEHDFGLCRPFAHIQGTVWIDSNCDGIMNSNENTVDEITVNLQDCNNNTVATTQTNGEGIYWFDEIEVGQYNVQFENLNGYTFSIGNDSAIETQEGVTACVDVEGNENYEFNAGIKRLSCVGDYIWNDANKNGIQDSNESGLSGITVTLYTENGTQVFETVSTANGQYEICNITPGNYYIELDTPVGYEAAVANAGNENQDSDGMAANGIVTSNIFTVTTDSNIENIDFGFCAIQSANIVGTVWMDLDNIGVNDNEQGFSGIEITLKNCIDDIISSTTTDQNGNYEFLNLPIGSYVVCIGSRDGYAPTEGPDSDVFNGQSVCLTLENNEQEIVDAGLAPFSCLGDFIWDDENKNGIQDPNEIGIPGITIQLYTAEGVLVSTEITDANGNYNFTDILPGAYYTQISDFEGWELTQQGVGSGNTNSDGMLSNGVVVTNIFQLSHGVKTDLLDFGFCRPVLDAMISGTVWFDINNNGVLENENYLDGVTITLLDCNENFITSTNTNGNGQYSFPNLAPGNYVVNVGLDSGFNYTFGPDVDINANGNSECLTLEGGDEEIVDAGLVPLVSIGDFIWNDANKNGIQDPGEGGVEGIIIFIYDLQGNYVGGTATNQDGKYWITNITPGDYYIQISEFEGYTLSPTNQGTNDNLDSDGMLVNGIIVTDPFTVSQGSDTSFDFGMCPIDNGAARVNIQGITWRDGNGDNRLDTQENSISSVNVRLVNCEGLEVSQVMTNENGEFSFNDIEVGSYYFVFDPPEGFGIAVGGESMIDNSNGIGSTPCIEITETFDELITAGVQPFSRIGNLLWIDSNENGIQDQGEEGLSGIIVSAFNDEQEFMNGFVSDLNGNYEINNLPPGNYYLQIDDFGGYLPTANNVGSDSNLDSDGLMVGNSIVTESFQMTDGQSMDDMDFGFVPVSFEVTGFTWLDENEDGLFNNESGIAEQSIIISDCNGNVIQSVLSDQSGNFEFTGITPGTYVFQVSTSNGYNYSPGGDSSFDANGITACLTLEENTTTNLSFGVTQETIENDENKIDVLVWKDSNGDTFRDESGLHDAQVTLYDCDGNMIDQILSNTDGLASFQNIPEGNYYIVADNGSRFAAAIGGDSQLTNGQAENSTDCFTISANQTVEITVGLIPLGSIGDFVWDDINGDGIQSAGEPGLANQKVGLFNENNQMLDLIDTDQNGSYSFDLLFPGTYSVRVLIPDGGYEATSVNAGNVGNDSNGTVVTDFVTSETTTLFDGSSDLTIDFGFRKVEDQVEDGGTITGLYFRDNNGDGDSVDDNGLANQEIKLKDCDGTQVMAVNTNEQGQFTFNNIPNGSYYIQFPAVDDSEFLLEGQSKITNNIEVGGTECFDFNTDNGLNISGGILPWARIGDFVWEDANEDGIQDNNEMPLVGFTVSLFDHDGTFLRSIETNENGKYGFTEVTPGNYYLQIDAPSYKPTESNVGGDMLDSDAELINNVIVTDIFPLYGGINNFRMDFGLIEKETIEVNSDDQFGTTGANIVLTLDVFPNAHILTWTDDQQTHGDTYLIMRSVDNGPFEVLYELVYETGVHLLTSDNNLGNHEVYMYKIRKVKPNGGLPVYSNVVTANRTEDPDFLIDPNIYPTPATSKINIDFKMLSDGDCDFKIYDMEGNMLQEVSFKNIQKGMNSLEIPLEFETTGNYIIHAGLGRHLYSTIITKVK